MHQERNTLRLRLFKILAAAVALAPASAHADERQQWTGGGGLNLGIHFGASDKPRFSVGIEGFGIRRTATFRQEPFSYNGQMTAGFGPLVQLNYVAGVGFRGTLAATAGWSPGNSSHALMAELGATYRFEKHDWGLRLGALYEPLVGNIAFRYDLMLNEANLSLGARLPGTFGAPFYPYYNGDWASGHVDGRPLRGADGARPERGQKSPTNLGEKWQQTAQDEYEAVFSFMNLAIELLAAGAPSGLVERALTSAEQEIVHTHYCLEQARRQSEGFSLSLPEHPHRELRKGAAALTRLAAEGLMDGFFGEGVASRRMAEGSKRVRCSRLAEQLSQIAAEERGHARLGADIASWALAADDTGLVREQLRRLQDQNLSPLEDDFSETSAGFPSSAFQSAVSRESFAATQRELAHLLKA